MSEWTSQNPDLNVSGMRRAPIVPISPDGAQERGSLPRGWPLLQEHQQSTNALNTHVCVMSPVLLFF